MSLRELDAAGITDPCLRLAYDECRRLHARHGRTYYLATRLLPPAKRPYVWALYGFARYADELVDSPTGPDAVALKAFDEAFRADLATGAVPAHPVALAMRDTMARWAIPEMHVRAFLDSMSMDLTVDCYPTYDDLRKYMYGSAAVIGLQMLPVLEPLDCEAEPRARALGEAFQLSNFIRDVGEDLHRGRLYLPLEDLVEAGLSRAELVDAQRRGLQPAGLPALLRMESERARALYAEAEPGIDLLHPTSRDAIRTAFVLYREILDAVQRNGYRVLDRRVQVPMRRRLGVALPAWRRARRARAISAGTGAGPTRPTETGC